MNKIWFKNISILLLGLFLIVDSNMIETTSSYLKIFDFVENYFEKLHHKNFEHKIFTSAIYLKAKTRALPYLSLFF